MGTFLKIMLCIVIPLLIYDCWDINNRLTK